ncbi:hypothetical protein [Consotaella aegiceratis]|uniref:hypothetical protein n=1 Tax=Consotaella aegiceratis TaxID=3097961 RepID=UPI002F40A1C5
MTYHARPDMIDRSAGLEDGGSVFALRSRRSNFLEGSEACRVSVLDPQDDLGLSPALRAAVARRVARSGGSDRLLAEYRAPAEAELAELAEGAMPADPALAAIAAHADMIAAEPAKASANHLAALADAGLTTPQIIALSELLAFVCFQIRVVHGLSLLDAVR